LALVTSATGDQRRTLDRNVEERPIDALPQILGYSICSLAAAHAYFFARWILRSYREATRHGCRLQLRL